MGKGRRWTCALAALALVSCARWEYSGSHEQPSPKAKRQDILVGTDLGFGLERTGDAVVVVATSTPMCRRAWFGSVDTVYVDTKSGVFGTKTRKQLVEGDWYAAWDGERTPCPGGASTPLVGRAVTFEGHFDALGTEFAFITQTTDAEGRARFDVAAEGTFSWVAAFCGHGTLQVHATPLPPEFATAGEPADTPTDPRVVEQGALVTELVAPMVAPAVDSVQWRYASRCRYGGVAADPTISAQALALAGPDAERAMALDACFLGITSACRPACAAGDPLGCQLECQHGGGVGCNDAGVALWVSDRTRAARYFAKGCQAGDATSCENLARSIERGETGRAADPAAVLAVREKACAAGNAEACQTLAAAAAATGGASTLPQCDVISTPDTTNFPVQICVSDGGCTSGYPTIWNILKGTVECRGEIRWTKPTLPCIAKDGSTSAITADRAVCEASSGSTPDPPEMTQAIAPLVDDWHREEEITPAVIEAKAPDCPAELCHCWAQSVTWTGTIQPAC